jgi:hypothetical protein
MAKNKMTKVKLLNFVERKGRATRPEILGELKRLRGVDHLSKTETRGYGCGWFRGSRCDLNPNIDQRKVAPYGMGPGPLLYQAGRDPRYLKPVHVKSVTYYEVATKKTKTKPGKIWDRPNTPSDDAFWADAYKTIKKLQS